MRITPLLCVVCAVSLTACDSSSAPEAKRGEVESAPATVTTGESTPAAETADRPAAVASETADEAASGELRLDKLIFTVPEGWQRKQTSSTFVLAEFALPKAEGDDADGRLTVSTAGGTVELNVNRWRDQFGGKPESAKDEKREVNGLSVTLVDFSGEFNDQRGPFAPATKRADYRMLAAIIPVDGELHFVKATGPKATIAAHAEAFQKFIDSVKKK